MTLAEINYFIAKDERHIKELDRKASDINFDRQATLAAIEFLKKMKAVIESKTAPKKEKSRKAKIQH